MSIKSNHKHKANLVKHIKLHKDGITMKIQEYFKKFNIKLLGCIILCGVFTVNTHAEGDKTDEETAAPIAAIYVPVIPAFVVNYGGQGKLKYIKLEVSLRVADSLSSNSVRHHMPLIRDYLVREFSRLNDVDVDTQQGKELVRVKALDGVKALMAEEEGDAVEVTGLYFNNFVVQR
jgi:flagellar FliL protein